MACPKCGSEKIYKAGTRATKKKGLVQRYRCGVCKRKLPMSVLSEAFNHQAEPYMNDGFIAPPVERFIPDEVLWGKRYVIVSIQNDVDVNWDFYWTLIAYCRRNNAELIVLPVVYNKGAFRKEGVSWPLEEHLLTRGMISLRKMVTVRGDFNVIATAINPLMGLGRLSKGSSVVFPHNQLAMVSLEVAPEDDPAMLITTGTISRPEYLPSKAGAQAEFNHSYSATVVEFAEDNSYHIRVLNGEDRGGFYDLDGYYTGDRFERITRVKAIVMGDEHAKVACPRVLDATYFADDSLVNTLRPEKIFSQDVFDAYSISHHDYKDPMLMHMKYENGDANLREELELTYEYLVRTTIGDCERIIIASNHHEHLNKWMNFCRPDTELWNRRIYFDLHQLMQNAKAFKTGDIVPDAFQLWIEDYMRNVGGYFPLRFLSRYDNFKIGDIECSYHGDIGVGGSRGSRVQYSRFGSKVIIGHSHTPGISQGAYSVGTMTPRKLKYTKGPSSWMNTHCIIYPNYKRQLITIIRGKYRA